jgi:hypothetical protein
MTIAYLGFVRGHELQAAMRASDALARRLRLRFGDPINMDNDANGTRVELRGCEILGERDRTAVADFHRDFARTTGTPIDPSEPFWRSTDPLTADAPDATEVSCTEWAIEAADGSRGPIWSKLWCELDIQSAPSTTSHTLDVRRQDVKTVDAAATTGFATGLEGVCARCGSGGGGAWSRTTLPTVAAFCQAIKASPAIGSRDRLKVMLAVDRITGFTAAGLLTCIPYAPPAGGKWPFNERSWVEPLVRYCVEPWADVLDTAAVRDAALHMFAGAPSTTC